MNIEVTSVSKHLEKREDVASAIQVVSQANIRNSGAKTVEDAFQKSVREAGHKYALEKSLIVTITSRKGVINHLEDNFCKISKCSKDKLIGLDCCIVNSDYHLNPNPHVFELV